MLLKQPMSSSTTHRPSQCVIAVVLLAMTAPTAIGSELRPGSAFGTLAAIHAWEKSSDAHVHLLAQSNTADESRSSFYQRHRAAIGVVISLVLLQAVVIVLLIFDRSRRRRAEQALRGVLKAAPIGIGVMRGREFQQVNDGLCQMLGYTESELVGQPVRMLYKTDEEYRRVGELGYDQLEELGMTSIETQWISRDGCSLDIILRLAALGGQAVSSGVTFAAMDVTHRRRAESELREQERMLRTLLSNLPGMAYRRRNDAEWSLEFASEGCCALSGYMAQALLGNREVPFVSLIHPDDRAAVCSEVKAAIQEKRSFEVTYRINTAQGAVRWVLDRGMAIGSSHDRPVVIEGFMSDITERRRAQDEREKLEDQVRYTQKMEAVGQLAGGVAHDFNNLLTVISSHAEMVRGQVPAGSEIFESMKMMERAVEQATSVTRSLLTFSQKLRTDRKRVNLCQTVDESAKMLWRTMPAAIQISLKTDCDPQPWICADATQIHQIILNLAINARDAMPKGGTLTIAVERPALATFSEGDEQVRKLGARLVIADTGTGMSDKTRARIFEPFFSTKGPGRGSGLGLAVVHGIVKEHEGAIEVSSTEGAGTRVTITFPCVDPADVDREVEELAIPRGAGETILLADDYPYVRSIIATTLASAGYEILQAGDGDACLKLFSEHRDVIDLLLLDVDLPHKSGFECLHEIRESGAHVPAIMITGRADEVVEDELEEGVMVFPKPFTMAELGRCVRDWLRRYKERSCNDQQSNIRTVG